MFFSYDSAIREAKRLKGLGLSVHLDKKWYGWIVVERCLHLEWRALGYGKRDPDSGKYLGRACICMKCGHEQLFRKPPNNVLDW